MKKYKLYIKILEYGSYLLFTIIAFTVKSSSNQYESYTELSNSFGLNPDLVLTLLALFIGLGRYLTLMGWKSLSNSEKFYSSAVLLAS